MKMMTAMLGFLHNAEHVNFLKKQLEDLKTMENNPDLVYLTDSEQGELCDSPESKGCAFCPGKLRCHSYKALISDNPLKGIEHLL